MTDAYIRTTATALHLMQAEDDHHFDLEQVGEGKGLTSMGTHGPLIEGVKLESEGDVVDVTITVWIGDAMIDMVMAGSTPLLVRQRPN